jgi:hypothetical protein
MKLRYMYFIAIRNQLDNLSLQWLLLNEWEYTAPEDYMEYLRQSYGGTA